MTWTPAACAVRDAVSWNGRGRPVLVERQRLAVQHERAGGQVAHHGDHLGQAGGDVVEGPGGHEHVVAVAVHLDPDAVELGVDGDLGALRAGHRGRDVGGARGQHRQHRASDLEADAASAPAPSKASRATALVDPVSIAARRTAASGTPAASGQRLLHQRVRRTLPHTRR